MENKLSVQAQTITAMITPFHADGTLDIDTAGKLAMWLADKGVDGLFLCGTTGEGLLLSMEERRELTQAVVSAAGKRVKVLVQAGGLTTAETIEIVRNTHETGADGAALLSPFFYKIDHSAMVNHFTAVALALPDLPLYLYNIPSNTHNPITPEILSEVLERTSNVAGIKDSSKDLVLLQKYLSLANESFSVFVGSDSVLLPGLAAGAVGVVSAASNAFPEAVMNVVHAFNSRNFSDALQAQQHLNTLLEIIKIGPTPAGYKAALKKRGIETGGVRPPLRNLNQKELSGFEQAWHSNPWITGLENI